MPIGAAVEVGRLIRELDNRVNGSWDIRRDEDGMFEVWFAWSTGEIVARIGENLQEGLEAALEAIR